MRYSLRLLCVGCSVTIAFPPARAIAQTLDPTAGNVPQTVRVSGSPQMGDLLHRYEEGFHKLQPNVRFQEDLTSTLTAVAGVYTGRADIGLLGREIWPTEMQAFQSVEGRAPQVTEVATGSYDVPKATFALMIFVHRSNPLARLSTDQLARVFGTTPSGSGYSVGGGPIHTWGELGLRGRWRARPLHLYGFSVENDKAQIFRQLIFKQGARWSCGLREYSSAAAPNAADAGELIVRAVGADPEGIGISNVHYATPEVRAVALSTAQHPAPIQPTRENVASNLYPLTRAVYMVTDWGRTTQSSAATLMFLRFVLSAQGKEAVLREGNYLPLTDAVAAEQRSKLAAP